LADLALLYRENRDILKGLKAQLEAIKIYPFRKKEYYSLCKIFALSLIGRKAFDRLRGRKRGRMDPSGYGKFNE
jgi:hypothetical protein